MKENISKSKIKFITLVFALSIVISSIAIGLSGWIFYNNIINYLEDKGTDIQSSNLKQLTRKVNFHFSIVENIAKITMNSDALKKELTEYLASNKNIYERGLIKSRILSRLQSMKSTNTDIESITLITLDTAFSIGQDIPLGIGTPDITNTNFGVDLLKNKDKPVFLSLENDLLTDKTTFFNKGSNFFVGSMFNEEKLVGLVFVKTNNKWINNTLNSNDKCAVIKNGNIVWKSPDFDGKIISSVIGGIDNKDKGILNVNAPKKERVFFEKLSTDEVYLLLEEDIQDTTNKLKSVRYYMFWSLLLSLFISIVLARILVGKIIGPFYKLIRNVTSYKNNVEPQEEMKSFKKLSLSMRERIIFHLILSVGIPIIVFVLFYYISSSNIIKERIILSNENVFNQSAENIGIFFERKLELFKTISQDYTIQGMLAEGNNMNNNTEYKKIINGFFSMWNSFENLSIYDSDKNMVYSTFNGNNTIESELITSQKNLKSGINWVGLRIDEYNQPVYVLIYVVKGVNLPPEYSKLNLGTIGYILSFINESQIEWIFRDINTTYNADVFVSDANDKVVSGILKTRLGEDVPSIMQELKNQKGNLVFDENIRGTPLKLNGIFNLKSVVNGIKDVLYSKLYLVVIILLILVLISYEIAYLLMRPLSKINYVISKYKLFDVLEIFPESSRIVEIEELGNAFNEMKLRTDKLLDDLLVAKIKEDRLEIAKMEAEVLSLLSQIRPHFLCNTLESVRCLIKASRNNEAIAMLKNLGDLFRYGLTKQETLITVEEELAYGLAYANIMSIRFGEKLKFIWNTDSTMLNSLTLKMILQPLIENAIEHGIAPKGGKGTIEITSSMDTEMLSFTVKDDGTGMDESKIMEISADQADIKGRANKIGLKNVSQRLSLYYKDKAELKISSEKGKGTEIIIRVPNIKKADKLMLK
ncbi:MAG TPA: histidine kinase [Ruminiclostridium sp.]